MSTTTESNEFEELMTRKRAIASIHARLDAEDAELDKQIEDYFDRQESRRVPMVDLLKKCNELMGL